MIYVTIKTVIINHRKINNIRFLFSKALTKFKRLQNNKLWFQLGHYSHVTSLIAYSLKNNLKCTFWIGFLNIFNLRTLTILCYQKHSKQLKNKCICCSFSTCTYYVRKNKGIMLFKKFFEKDFSLQGSNLGIRLSKIFPVFTSLRLN